MSKLILVSSREPYVLRHANGAGVTSTRVRAGLLGAIEPLLHATAGHWVSWSGLERESKNAEVLPDRMDVSEPGAEFPWSLRRVPISEREASLFYYGFACRTLWPLMHLHLGSVRFDAEAWRAFKRVNQRFTDAVLEAYEPGDKIWVLDHALCLVPGMLREARPDAAIAASWTIPFAPPDVLRALPWASEIVHGLMGASYVGVGLPRDANHMREAAAIGGVAITDDGALHVDGRRVAIGAIPLGCDAAAWAARGMTSRGGRAIRLRRSLVADKLALAVDRVEKMRGIDVRMAAIERFFDRYPSWRGRLVFCQIAVPSRTRAEEYRDLKREIDAAVTRVNTRFGDGNWQPVRYLYRAFEPDELAVYYAAADVALCTPLADGMSFVPLEYAATRTRDDGSLVVSSLAGSADALPEALQVNPYDEDAVAATLHDALESSPERAGSRMRALRKRVQNDDAKAFLTRFWSAAFGAELQFAPERPAAPTPSGEWAAVDVEGRQDDASDVGSHV